MIYYLSLGSNMGDKSENLNRAIEALKTLGDVKKISNLHVTKPWGYREQEDFLNCAIEFESPMKPKDALRAIKGIEQRIGREKTFRWGPRVIDIDILLCFDEGKEISCEDEELTIPHKHLCERDFYLVCLKDLGIKKVCGREIDELIKEKENAK